ncbi:MAG: DUF6261 family protein [Dysgonamonadaceae bacterium]|jgi:hypothetical protein|nr:DUF6261 family protein [Dysgonamonadaceae bacterium]
MGYLIIRINLEGLKNETHYELNKNTDRVFVKFDPETLGIAPLYSLYHTSFLDEKEALDFITRSEYTQKIVKQDHVRDSIYRGFVDTVNAAKHHYNPVYVEAAEMIDNVIKHYGNISRKSLDDESAAIEDLLYELQQPALAQAVVRIGLTPWKEKLELENNTLRQLITERYDETAGKTSYRMKTVRSEVDKYYHAIVNRLESDHLAGVEINPEFLKELNAVIERYKRILSQERGERKPVNGQE